MAGRRGDNVAKSEDEDGHSRRGEERHQRDDIESARRDANY